MSAGGVERQSATIKMCLACSREFDADLTTCPTDGTALISIQQSDNFVGQVLGGHYLVSEEIGRGGMGVVYLARHQMMDRLVAIKMLQAELLSDELSVKRFKQEAQAASCLSHPHIITLHDFGILNTGQPYLVMEYLEGVPLLHIIKGEGPLQPERAVKIFTEVADALHHAHVQGIVHRDLKPSNIILINKDGDPDFVKVVDFGLAKLMPWSGKESQHLTKTGEVFGSPIYMSPEQCMGKELRPTSDVYSLGITLFEALTGKPPFRGQNSIATASKHMNEAPPRFTEVRPDLVLPENLERVVLKTLAKEPKDRFQDMAEFKDALIGALKNDAPIELPPSLMVSRHQIPVLDPTKVSGSTETRRSSVSELRSIQSGQARSKQPAIIAGVVAVVAGLAAGAWYMLSPVTHEAEGVLTYYDGRTHEIHLQDGNGMLRKLTVPETATGLEKLDDSAEHRALGRHLQVKYTTPRLAGDEKTGTVVDATGYGAEGPDEQIDHAQSETRHALEAIASGRFDLLYAFPVPTEQLKREFPPGTLQTADSNVFHEDRQSSAQPLHSIKVAEFSPTSVTLLVSKADFYRNKQGFGNAPYWKVVFEKNKMTQFEDAPASEWDKY